MSRRWTAKCWMGGKSGYVDIEVNASTFGGAKEQLQNIYGAEQIINLREIPKTGGSSSINFSSGSGGAWVVGLLGGGALLLYFTPWVLMTLYGAGAAWISEKITGQSIEEYADTNDEETSDGQHTKALITVAAALFFGGLGFIQGTSWNKELNKEYNLDGNQTKVEEVRQKN